MIALLLTIASLGSPDSVPLYGNLGDYQVRITTSVPAAQQYFNQGMRLLYAFNHVEAIRSFREAARRDSTCAMCYWGVAYAYGPHVNASMDSASGVAAYEALTAAMQRLRYASPREGAYISALARRYTPVPRAARAALDSAYARAMGGVANRYPNDLDAATLHAEALMDLSPWNYWDQKTGDPRPDTPQILAQLERVLKANPQHPGACHFYIHAVEAATPEKAVPCAERLAALMPGAGHLVHMPAHIYIRVGRYGDAIDQNVHAVHADEAYIEGQRPEGLYRVAYVPHNYHFLSFAASLAGRSAQAIDAATKTAATTSWDLARDVPFLEPFAVYPFLTLITFGRWNEVLALPLPPADLRFSAGLAHYARGIAFAALGRPADAAAALDTVRRVAGETNPAYVAAGWVTPKTVMEIALHALQGEIAARGGRHDEAIGHFQAAAALEDGLQYIEPPDWYYPIRHSLGAALLQAGKPAEAEAVYREDLKRFPENGWSLYGLAQALHAQGKGDEAAETERRFERAWAGADVKLTASRF
jgi:tetratricopeptide (TPR) repeat protein